MREIKFRAWSKKLNKMLEDIYIDDGSNMAWDKYKKIHIDIPGDALFMQYTGFKDKNGKEIYKGDIINGDYPDEVIWSDERGQWMLRNSVGPDDTLWEIHRDNDIEIIGNKFENPELLEEKE